MDLKNRYDLAKLFHKLGFTKGAEIGVDKGIYSEVLCKTNPKLKLFSIDIWYKNAGGSIQRRRRSYIEAKNRLSLYNAELIIKSSLDAAKDFENNSLDFVYIDAGHHFDDIMQDLIHWSKKVKKGGIVAGHDYIKPSRQADVKAAVDAYTKAHSYHINITSDSSESNSWWFIKRWNS